MIADVVVLAAVTAVFFVTLRRQLKRVEAAAPPRTLTVTLTADTSQFRAALAEASRGLLILPDGEAHDVTVTAAPWQRTLVERVADAYTRGEPVEYFQAMFSRRTTRAQFRAALDLEMHRRGWTIVAPGVYQPPDSPHHNPTGQATFTVADETRLWTDDIDDDDVEGCSHCGGEGLTECDDPIQCTSSRCDGQMCPCGACGGTGRAEDQVIW